MCSPGLILECTCPWGTLPQESTGRGAEESNGEGQAWLHVTVGTGQSIPEDRSQSHRSMRTSTCLAGPGTCKEMAQQDVKTTTMNMS